MPRDVKLVKIITQADRDSDLKSCRRTIIYVEILDGFLEIKRDLPILSLVAESLREFLGLISFLNVLRNVLLGHFFSENDAGSLFRVTRVNISWFYL